MGIRDRPTSSRSPWQNGYAERLIGSIRRECLDHVVVFGERHLRHILLSYMKYHNEVRTHLSLEKDAPASRAVERAEQILCPQFSTGYITNMSGFDLRQGHRPVWSVSRHKRKSIGADVDLYARPVDGRRTRAISQSGIAHNAVCRINRRSA